MLVIGSCPRRLKFECPVPNRRPRSLRPAAPARTGRQLHYRLRAPEMLEIEMTESAVMGDGALSGRDANRRS